MRKEELVGKIREFAAEVENLDIEGLDSDTLKQIQNAISGIVNEGEDLDSRAGECYEAIEEAKDYTDRAYRKCESIGTDDLSQAVRDLERILEDIEGNEV